MLKVENVSKLFESKKSSFLAVDDVSFDVKKGEIVGLIGTNGAGKTTTMRMIATILKPTGGTITINDENIMDNQAMARRKIGLLFGGDTGLYDRLTARENIAYFAELNGLDEEQTAKRIAELSKSFDMSAFLDRKAGTFSRGMKQKTAFARSIVHDPEIMLFDEPTAGLDILVAEEVISFIKQCKEMNKAVLLSSHDMTEVKELCDRVVIINKGKIVASGTIESLKQDYQKNSIKEVFMTVVGYQKGEKNDTI